MCLHYVLLQCHCVIMKLTCTWFCENPEVTGFSSACACYQGCVCCQILHDGEGPRLLSSHNTTTCQGCWVFPWPAHLLSFPERFLLKKIKVVWSLMPHYSQLQVTFPFFFHLLFCKTSLASSVSQRRLYMFVLTSASSQDVSLLNPT